MAANLTSAALNFLNSTSIQAYGDASKSVNITVNGTVPDNALTPLEFKSPPLKVEDIITLPLYALIFILSVVGNLLVIITLIQNKRMRTVTNVFLLNLSMSDLLLAVFCMPFTIVPIMLKNFIFGAAMCVLIRYMQTISVTVSCFTLVAISMERYFAICRPFSSRKWQTLSHSYRIIAVCWIVAFIISIPTAVYNKYTLLPRGNAICREIWPDPLWHKMYTIFLDILLLVLPILIMTLSYGKIAYTLWSGMQMDKQEEAMHCNGTIFKLESVRKSESTFKDGFGRTIGPSDIDDLNKPIKTSSKARFATRTGLRQINNERSRAAKKRVIKMLFAVVLEFFVCWTPLFILQTWMTIDINHAQENLSQIILTAMFLLGYISSCCNPITYCFMNKNFRNGFKSAFRCCRLGEGVRTRNDMPSYYQHSTTRTGVSHALSYDKVNTQVDSDEL